MAHAYLVKLVRDRISENSVDSAVKFLPIEDDDLFIEKLREKLGEEVVEYLLKPSLSEAGDIFAVLCALVQYDLGYRQNDLTLEQRRASYYISFLIPHEQRKRSAVGSTIVLGSTSKRRKSTHELVHM